MSPSNLSSSRNFLPKYFSGRVVIVTKVNNMRHQINIGVILGLHEPISFCMPFHTLSGSATCQETYFPQIHIVHRIARKFLTTKISEIFKEPNSGFQFQQTIIFFLKSKRLYFKSFYFYLLCSHKIYINFKKYWDSCPFSHPFKSVTNFIPHYHIYHTVIT